MSAAGYKAGRGEALPDRLVLLLMLLAALPFILPLLWMLSTAFKPAEMVYASPPQWLPGTLTLENFEKAWGLLDFPAFIRNSLLISSLCVVGSVLSSSLVGFAFAAIPARGKQALLILLLSTIMIPSTVTVIPLFVGFSRLGMTNTYLPLVLPSFFANAFFVFLFRQYFRTIPQEMLESAELDGCNPLGIYWWIALPLARPALAAAAVFAFIASWNEFLNPLIYLSTNDRFTLSLGLSLFNGLFYTQLQYLMPMSLVALTPIIIVFLIAQRHLVQGVVTT
jgi:multiple sugar transport system permease protein